MKNIPRRIQLDQCIPAELYIFKAMEEVEKLGAGVKLTEAIIKLQEAKELISDYIDNTKVNIEMSDDLKKLCDDLFKPENIEKIAKELEKCHKEAQSIRDILNLKRFITEQLFEQFIKYGDNA